MLRLPMHPVSHRLYIIYSMYIYITLDGLILNRVFEEANLYITLNYALTFYFFPTFVNVKDIAKCPFK